MQAVFGARCIATDCIEQSQFAGGTGSVFEYLKDARRLGELEGERKIMESKVIFLDETSRVVCKMCRIGTPRVGNEWSAFE